MSKAAPIVIIAAVSRNGIIGVHNTLPWVFKEDLQRFKRLTTHNTVVMGRKTYESIGRPLPNRNNVVISKTLPARKDYAIAVVPSLTEAIPESSSGDTYPLHSIFIIGGSQLYAEAMGIANVLEITEVDQEVRPEIGAPVAYFPAIPACFRETLRVPGTTPELTFVTYVRDES